MAKWTIDPSHSEVQFKVKHLMISTVTGDFKSYEGEVNTTDESFEGADIRFSAAIDSISTGNDQRDGHLKSPDFFDAASFPDLSFQSTSFTKTGDDTYSLKGDFTIKGVTKSIELKAEYGGEMVDFYNNTKAGFDIQGKISRKEFGLSWDAVTEAGGVVVGDDVKLHLNIQLAKA